MRDKTREKTADELAGSLTKDEVSSIFPLTDVISTGAFRAHQDIWLIQCAIDEYFELPKETSLADRTRAIRYVFALCYLLVKGLEKHAGAGMEEGAATKRQAAVVRKPVGRQGAEIQGTQVIEIDKKESVG